MYKFSFFLASSLTLALNVAPIQGYEDSTSAQQAAANFQPFTGRINKNKVRLRQQASLDSPILRELNQGDLLIVVGENEDFYAVQPPADIKAYVFRTFILDNVVEGTRVNVRLEPDTEAPVIAQLASGERVDGVVSPLNSKWLEITPPPQARFYVSKNYIDKIGNAALMATIEKRREEVNSLLNSTYLSSQSEMQKSFPEISLDGIYANFNTIINSYRDFPDQVARAKELVTALQENYLQKKLAYLEAKTKNTQNDWHTRTSQMNEQMQAQQQRVAELEMQLQMEKASREYASRSSDSSTPAQKDTHGYINNKMMAWEPVEQAIYAAWLHHNPNGTPDEFYREQQQQAATLRGIIEPYTRAIKNKPGDYILVNESTHLPVAYLYSTQINLQDRVGQVVTIQGSARANNNFAFPAYFVLALE